MFMIKERFRVQGSGFKGSRVKRIEMQKPHL
jgi:hypothetical protein